MEQFNNSLGAGLDWFLFVWIMDGVFPTTDCDCHAEGVTVWVDLVGGLVGCQERD